MSRFGPSDFAADVALGRVPNWSCLNKFGRNDSSATGEAVWATSASATTSFIIAAETMDVNSNNAADAAAGAGAQKVTIEGLNGSFAEISEEIALTGSGTSTTTATFIRVNRAYVSEAGTYHVANTADIDIIGNTTAIQQATILAGKGQTEKAIYCVPASTSFVLKHIDISVETAKTIGAAELFVVRTADDVATAFTSTKRKLWGASGLDGLVEHVFQCPPVIIGPADVWMELSGTVAATPTVEAHFGGYLVVTS